MPRSASPLFTPAFFALTLADLAYFTAAGLMIFVTPFFVTGPLASADATVGLVMGSFSVSTLVLRPYVGRLVDRHGRRRLLVGGAAAFAMVVAGHALATTIPVLVGLRLLLGAAEAFFFVAGFAALADLAPPGRAGEALSFNSLSLYLGVALGPLLGETLLRVGGFGLAWAGGTALAGIAVALALRVPETGDRSSDAEPSAWIQRRAVGPGLGLFAGVAGMSVFFAYVSLHADALGLRSASTVLLVFGVVVVVCRVAFARLPDRLPALPLSAGSLALSAVALTWVALSRDGIGLVSAAVLLAMGVAFLTPATFVAIFASVPPSERGAAAATASIFIDLGLGGGPLMAGLAVAQGELSAAFAAGAGMAGVGAVAMAGLAVRRRGPAV